MKNSILLFLLCMLGIQTYSQNQGDGIHFLEGEPWDNVLKMAQQQNKYIFMDCYTSWCGPCKALSKDIFTRKDVGDFFNANFINVKYDMEKGVGKDLRKQYQENIIGYPTLLLIGKDGKVVHQMAGFQEAGVLIAGMKAGMEGNSLFAFKDKYASGNRDLNFIKDYVAALEGAFMRDEIAKVVVDYINTLPLEKLKEKDVWDLVGTHIKDPFSPQFNYVIFNLDYFPAKLKVDRYKLEWQLNWAMEKALNQIVELKKDDKGKILPLTDEPAKLDTLSRLIKRANLKRAEEYRAKIRIHELELAADWDEVYNYLMVCRSIGALGYSDRFLDEVIQYMAVNCKDKALLKKCLTLIEELQAKEENSKSKMKSNYYDTLSLLHEQLGNTKKAKEYREMDEKIKQENAKAFEEFMKSAK